MNASVTAVCLPHDDPDLVLAWDDLAHHAAEPNAFAERWFVQASTVHLAEAGELLAVHDKGHRLTGLIRLRVAGRYGRFPLRHWVNPMHPHCLLGTPLVRAGCEQPFWQAVLAWLDRHRRGALLHLNGLVEDGPVLAALGQVRRAEVVHRIHRAVLKAGLSPAAYLETHVRAKKRKEWRRQAARLAERGAISHDRIEDGAALSAWIDDYLALEASGWKGRAGSALALKPETRAFFTSALTGAAAAGRLELRRITLEGRPIAMMVNFLCPPGSFSFKIAFDEDHARYSPGVLVELDNLAILERPDIHWMDSCAVEDHPMIDHLWADRRAIVRVTVPLSGLRRTGVFRGVRLMETGAARVRDRRQARTRPMGEACS